MENSEFGFGFDSGDLFGLVTRLGRQEGKGDRQGSPKLRKGKPKCLTVPIGIPKTFNHAAYQGIAFRLNSSKRMRAHSDDSSTVLSCLMASRDYYAVTSVNKCRS